MTLALSPHALEVALDWLDCRANDPTDPDDFARGAHEALSAGNGTADLAADVWATIIDDLARESESEFYTLPAKDPALLRECQRLAAAMAQKN